MWVYDAELERIVQRDITYVPGLYKIFDEILVNAADNKQRDPKMNVIKVTIDNFPDIRTRLDDTKCKELVGGRNGYGAKLCNVFSTRFTIETSSKEYGKSFKQQEGLCTVQFLRIQFNWVFNWDG
uniref:DNA topoisomerase (ATP-hydrolyzing) n=1 Tax=Parascaris equorum TaxID=6256 RepID=A0A914S5S6_PAREQ